MQIKIFIKKNLIQHFWGDFKQIHDNWLNFLINLKITIINRINGMRKGVIFYLKNGQLIFGDFISLLEHYSYIDCKSTNVSPFN